MNNKINCLTNALTKNKSKNLQIYKKKMMGKK